MPPDGLGGATQSSQASLFAADEISGVTATGLPYRILVGDAREGLAAIPPRSVGAICTSPPYFWQRDYGVDGQIGHEATIEGYVSQIASVLNAARHVLANDGLLFLNIGDAYYGGRGKPGGSDPKYAARNFARQKLRALDKLGLGVPKKSLIGLPFRVVIALQDAGWHLIREIAWRKPGVLTEPSVSDRPYRTYEPVYVLAKTERPYIGPLTEETASPVWTIPARPKNPFAHAAPYPDRLVELCLEWGCRPGAAVLDPFLGSATTALVALRMGHPAIGIELNQRYAAQAHQRLRTESHGRS